MTDKDKKRLAELRDQGYTYQQIAIGARDESKTVPAGKGFSPLFFTASSVIFLWLS